MSVTYFQRSDASDLTGTPSEVGNRVASRTAGSGGALIGSGNMNSTVTRSLWFFTPSTDPGTDGTSTGTFTVIIRFTTQNANIGVIVHLHRLNSSGTSQASVSSASQTAGAATRTYTFNSPALGTWAAGDRLGVRVQFTNNSGSMNQSCEIGVDTSDDTIDTPFTAAAPPTGGTMRRWTGSAFVPGGTLKRWTGSVFATGGTLRRWTGSGWEPPP